MSEHMMLSAGVDGDGFADVPLSFADAKRLFQGVRDK